MGLMEKIKNGDDLIDVWSEFDHIDMDVEKAVDFADKAGPIQIEAIKASALETLTNEMIQAPEPNDRITAAKALLQHYRDEKKRLGAIVKKPDVDPNQGNLFGPWDIKNPGSSL